MINNTAQIIYFLTSALCWVVIGKGIVLKKRVSILLFLPLFPCLMGLFGGMEYLSAATLLVNIICLISALFFGVKERKGNGVLFFISLFFLFGMTLLFRDMKSSSPVYIVPFWSIAESLKTGNYARLGHFINNIVLFIPFGLFASLMTEKKRQVLLSGTLLSCTIELMQFMFILGESDIDDLIANSFGTFLGILLYILFFGKGKNKGRN